MPPTTRSQLPKQTNSITKITTRSKSQSNVSSGNNSDDDGEDQEVLERLRPSPTKPGGKPQSEIDELEHDLDGDLDGGIEETHKVIKAGLAKAIGTPQQEQQRNARRDPHQGAEEEGYDDESLEQVDELEDSADKYPPSSDSDSASEFTNWRQKKRKRRASIKIMTNHLSAQEAERDPNIIFLDPSSNTNPASFWIAKRKYWSNCGDLDDFDLIKSLIDEHNSTVVGNQELSYDQCHFAIFPDRSSPLNDEKLEEYKNLARSESIILISKLYILDTHAAFKRARKKGKESQFEPARGISYKNEEPKRKRYKRRMEFTDDENERLVDLLARNRLTGDLSKDEVFRWLAQEEYSYIEGEEAHPWESWKSHYRQYKDKFDRGAKARARELRNEGQEEDTEIVIEESVGSSEDSHELVEEEAGEKAEVEREVEVEQPQHTVRTVGKRRKKSRR
ncbi:hypothetical protein T439DRAFT_322758 [Meredithblackwellia eburnea MCA 4105]